MKTPRRRQNPLRTPLNGILGTEANVRLLRVLANATTPVASGELARRAQLGRTTIYPALEALELKGIVEFVGAGARKQAQLRGDHPLARPLVELFAAEEGRVEGLVQSLRDLLQGLVTQPVSAWVEGLGITEGHGSETVPLWVVAEPRAIASLTSALAAGAGPIERRHGVHLDIHGLTRSELEQQPRARLRALTNAILLAGVPPMALLRREAGRGRRGAAVKEHDEHDNRSRRLAVAIAAKLKWDPSLVRVARNHIEARSKQASARERQELAEWLRLLDTMSPGQLQRFLLGEDEKATRLRQSLPALNLLTPAERDAVLASATDQEARAAVLGE